MKVAQVVAREEAGLLVHAKAEVERAQATEG